MRWASVKRLWFTSEFFQKDSIFFLQIFDNRLLVAFDPTGDHEKQDPSFHLG
jgi:hypothetical protein